MKKIALHIGAHKTASTFLQYTLFNNIQSLYDLGVDFHDLESMRRSKLSSSIQKHIRNQMALSQEQKIDFCSAMVTSSKYDRVIISHENLIGVPTNFIKKSTVYPRFEESLVLLKEIFNEHEIEIFFCIRDFATFLPSNYCEALRTNPQQPNFRTCTKNIDWELENWVKYVNLIKKVFPSSKITLWRYEKVKEVEYFSEMVKSLIGCSLPLGFSVTSGKVRVSMPAKAIRTLNFASQIYSDEELKQLLKFLNSEMHWDDNISLNPWSEIELKFHSDSYFQDLEKISAMGGNVRLL